MVGGFINDAPRATTKVEGKFSSSGHQLHSQEPGVKVRTDGGGEILRLG